MNDDQPSMPSSKEEIDFGPLAHSVGFLLRIAQLRNFDDLYSRFDDGVIRPGEFSVMWLVHLNPGIRQGHLARILSIKPANMTKLVRSLEELNRLERVIPDNDRRSVCLHLTQEGQEFVEGYKRYFFDRESDRVHTLSDIEMETLIGLLRKYSGFDT